MRNKIFQVSFFTLIVLNAFLFTDLAHSASGGDTWKFQVAPYIWLAGQNGKVATIPPLPPADIDIDFYDDILGNIKGALMLVGEARKGSYGIVADVAYIDIELENSTPGPFFTLLTSRTQSWIVSVAGLYRLIENQESFLDFIGGARYWSVDSNLTLQEGLLSPRSVSNKEDWFDPFIGMKGLAPLGESKFYVSGFLVIGGFGAGSDFMWDANINLGYQWTETFSTTFGYRYFDVDYENGDFIYDVAQDGLMLGFSWRF